MIFEKLLFIMSLMTSINSYQSYENGTFLLLFFYGQKYRVLVSKVFLFATKKKINGKSNENDSNIG